MILRIKGREKGSRMSSFFFMLLVIMYTVAYNNRLRGNSIVWYGVSVAVVAYLGIQMLVRKKIQINALVGWCLAFYSFSILSLIWAPEKGFFNPLKSMLLIYVTIMLLSVYFDSRTDLEKLMFINYVALALCAIYVLSAVDRSQLGDIRISSDMEGAWNSNDISVKMSAGLCLSLYFFYRAQKRGIKLAHLLLSILFIIMIFYCGSRTGALMMIGVIVMYMLMRAKGIKLVKAIIGVAVALVIFYILIMNYEPIYNVLGKRIEDAIDGLFGGSTDDGSFNWRMLMVSRGLEWLTQRPILGYGVDNFRFLLGADANFETYSHNNFIEMLVNGGIVGFVLYYSIYFYIFVKLWKPAVKQKDMTAIAIFVINLIKLVMQISTVTYYNTDAYTMLLFAVIYITHIEKKSHTNCAAVNE